MRHQGSTIDVETQRVRDRDGNSYAAENLVVAHGALYYERHIGSRDPAQRQLGQQFYHQQRWVLPAHGWVFNRFAFFADFPRPVDWYIETELITVGGPLWRIADGYLDVEVFEGVRYEVDDAHELAEGMLCGDISLDDAAAALTSLHELCQALERLDFSGAALLAKYAPGLPPPGDPR